MRRFLVLGTDTGVGKTFFSGLLAAVYEKKTPHSTLYIKPFQTGVTEVGVAPLSPPNQPSNPLEKSSKSLVTEEAADQDTVRTIIRSRITHSLEDRQFITLRSYPLAASPHLAAELVGTPLTAAAIEEIGAELKQHLTRHTGNCAVIEGVGGLLVPLSREKLPREVALSGAGLTENNKSPLITFADFMTTLGRDFLESLEILLVARTGLGTLNHTLLTLEALAHRNLSVTALFLNDYFSEPSSLNHPDSTHSPQPPESHSTETILANNAEVLSAFTEVPVIRFRESLPETAFF